MNLDIVRSNSLSLAGVGTAAPGGRADGGSAPERTAGWFNEALDGESHVLRAPVSYASDTSPQVLTERFIASLCVS